MTTIEKQNKIAELKAEIKAIIEEREEFFDALEEAEHDLEIPQFHIDYLNREIERLGDDYQACWAEIDKLQATA